MRKIIFSLLVFIAISLNLSAQKETNIWYFGYYTGMDFNQTHSQNIAGFGEVKGIPKNVPGPFSTAEGCFSISGKDGKVLFSSDGRTIYNKNNAVMQAGLKGHNSSTQSGIVVPIPGTIGKYYVITAPYEGLRVGFFYNIVDMGLNNGLGKVTTLNQPITMGTTGIPITQLPENVTAVGHANGIDYWLICRLRNKFVVWSITKDGILNPKSYIVNHDMARSNQGMGYIKFSPDGKKVVHGDYTEGWLSYADFNPETGVISNQWSVFTNMGKVYGVEFSPNCEYLYLTSIQYDNKPENDSKHGLYSIKIADLPKYGNTTPLNLTKKVNNISNVQLSSDGRIYCISQYRQTSLWIILNPNEGGTKVAEIPNYFTTALPWLGLPPFVTSFFILEKVKCNKLPCVHDEESYEIQMFQGTGLYEVAYMVWNFGDASPTVRQDYKVGQTLYQQNHQYIKVGKHTITVTPYRANGTAISDEIIIDEVYPRYCNLIINTATTN